jgi:hypothetical protein
VLLCVLYFSSKATHNSLCSSCTSCIRVACFPSGVASTFMQRSMSTSSIACRCWRTFHQHTTTAQNCQKPWRPAQQQQPAQHSLQTCSQQGGCITHIKGVQKMFHNADSSGIADGTCTSTSITALCSTSDSSCNNERCSLLTHACNICCSHLLVCCTHV